MDINSGELFVQILFCDCIFKDMDDSFLLVRGSIFYYKQKVRELICGLLQVRKVRKGERDLSTSSVCSMPRCLIWEQNVPNAISD
jgi:hypothetical protein